MKQTVIGKKYFTNLFVLDHGGLTWFSPIYQVPFAKFCLDQILHFKNFPFVTFSYRVSEIPHEFFFSQKF